MEPIKYEKFNTDYILVASGFRNAGSTCWWNSALQLIMSLPLCNEFILADKKNALSVAMGELIQNLMAGMRTADVRDIPAALLTAMLDRLGQLKPKHSFEGQQCALEAIENLYACLDVRRLNESSLTVRENFAHKCAGCGATLSLARDTSNFIEIDVPVLSREEFESFARMNVSALSNYKCDSCGLVNSTIHKISALRAIRECVIVVFNKNIENSAAYVKFAPPVFSVVASDSKYLNYILVGRIQHIGTLAGGHYFANVVRKSSTGLLCVCQIDDENIYPGSFDPSPDTFICAYQLYNVGDRLVDSPNFAPFENSK